MANDYDNKVTELRENIRILRQQEDQIRTDRQMMEQELRTLLARHILYPPTPE